MKHNSILKSLAVIIALSFTFTLAAKEIIPSRNTATESRKLSPFKDIEVSSVVTVKYVKADKYSATLQAPSNVLPYIELSHEGDELEITMKSGLSFKGDPKATVTIYAPSLRNIDLGGASTFNAEELLGKNKISIEGGGASTFNIGHVNVPRFQIEADGATTVNINDITSTSLSIEASGASTLNLKGITASTLKAECSGATTTNLSGTATEASIEAEGASTVNAKKLSVVSGAVSASGASTLKARFDNYTSTSCSRASKLDIR